MFQRARFDISIFLEELKSRMNFSQIIPKGSDGNVLMAGFPGELINVESVWGSRWPVLYNKGYSVNTIAINGAGMQQRCYFPYISK